MAAATGLRKPGLPQCRGAASSTWHRGRLTSDRRRTRSRRSAQAAAGAQLPAARRKAHRLAAAAGAGRRHGRLRRRSGGARHVPDEVLAVAEVPRTLTGKKMEVPVRKLLLRAPRETV